MYAKNKHSGAIVDYLAKVTGEKEESASENSDSSGHLYDHIVSLQKNWRFSEDSGISQLAIATNSAKADLALEILKEDHSSECKLILPEELNETDLISSWKHYFEVLNDPKSSIKEIFEAFHEYRVLCALRKGPNGSTAISSRIETIIAKQGLINSRYFSNQATRKTLGQKQNWYHGRPVMITQNSYNKGLYNGDTGITLMDENGQAKVWFPENPHQKKLFSVRALSPLRVIQILRSRSITRDETTWAMTIHKSQVLNL
ncbi:RecBCD enzyme subunit RecD [Nymphon striatum]|nr:RecBCD enzyme subunit RecD [Nymphon striatum]